MLLLYLSHRIMDRESYFSLIKRTKTQSIFIVLVITLLWLSNVSAATINANSCSQTDVQVAINIASTGDIVSIPPGTCIWSTCVSIPNSKKITLVGAGMNSTVITRSPQGFAIDMNRSGSRITGFSFIQGRIVVDGEGWRIDHCEISLDPWTTGINANATINGTTPIGLVDNCIFNKARVCVTNAWLLNHGVWAQPLGLGTNNAVFVEDCVFHGITSSSINCIDSNYGGRYVFRFNTVNDSSLDNHSVQGTHRASRSWEIYNNAINQVYTTMWNVGMMRGGTGVIFNNTITGTYTVYKFSVDNIRSCYDRGEGDFCDGNSLYDGNEAGEAGYPCRDQIGRSTDQWLWTDANSYPPQALEPAYCWNNKHGTDEVSFYQHSCLNSKAHIQPNRDYYNYDASFDGSSGVGAGTLANRPTTCTAGVAYWATDQGSWNKTPGGEQGVLYKCISKNTWEKYYEPYTYPHPLRQAEPIGELQPPQNLRIEEHSLSVTTSGNGSVDVVPNQDTYSFGQQVTLTAMADPGWVFSGWSGDLAGNDNPVTLTISGDHKVTATFADSATLAYSEGFEAYNDGDDPVDWLDTATNNNMSEDNSLFQVVDVGGEKVFGTASTLTNIHSHYTGSGSTVFSNYEYTGRMMMTESSGGIGVTLLSQYPVRDAYYRLRRYKSNSFHISPHGTSIFGVTDTGVVPIANNWYRFRVRVQDTGIRMEILAKVWLDGDVEPIDWQVNAYDDTDNRLTSGTFGVWGYLIGSKYWDDLMVIPLSP